MQPEACQLEVIIAYTALGFCVKITRLSEHIQRCIVEATQLRACTVISICNTADNHTSLKLGWLAQCQSEPPDCSCRCMAGPLLRPVLVT